VQQRAEVRDENCIRTRRRKNAGRKSRFPLANFRGHSADGTAGAAEASFLPFTHA
jgi:hypothetical protein